VRYKFNCCIRLQKIRFDLWTRRTQVCDRRRIKHVDSHAYKNMHTKVKEKKRPQKCGGPKNVGGPPLKMWVFQNAHKNEVFGSSWQAAGAHAGHRMASRHLVGHGTPRILTLVGVAVRGSLGRIGDRWNVTMPVDAADCQWYL
jgi:hypothetical protein